MLLYIFQHAFLRKVISITVNLSWTYIDNGNEIFSWQGSRGKISSKTDCTEPAFHLFFFLRYFGVSASSHEHVIIQNLISHWLPYFNSAINPIIYNFMSGELWINCSPPPPPPPPPPLPISSFYFLTLPSICIQNFSSTLTFWSKCSLFCFIPHFVRLISVKCAISSQSGFRHFFFTRI